MDGRVVRRHQDQIISCVPVENDFEFPMHVEDPVPEPAVIPESNPLLDSPAPVVPAPTVYQSGDSVSVSDDITVPSTTNTAAPETAPVSAIPLLRSTRERHPPHRLICE